MWSKDTMLSLSDFIVSLFLREAEHNSLILQRQILHRGVGGGWQIDYHVIIYTVTSTTSPSAEPGTCRAGELHAHIPQWDRTSREGILAHHPTTLCILQGCFKALTSCHSTESSWCRERWRKVEPFKGRVAAVAHWFQGEEGVQLWGPGQPRSHQEHAAELEFKFALRPQWQGHSSSGLTMQNSQDTC